MEVAIPMLFASVMQDMISAATAALVPPITMATLLAIVRPILHFFMF